MEEVIARRLEDGFDHEPDWRARIVQQYLKRLAASTRPDAEFEEICYSEKDPFIRQYLRFKYKGQCVDKGSFEQAARCVRTNPATGIASLIKTLAVADRRSHEIAKEVGMQSRSVATFLKLFFDIERNLDNEAWLQRICLGSGGDSMEVRRERAWLTVAFRRGWNGVLTSVLRRRAATEEDINDAYKELTAALARRATDYVLNLDDDAVPPKADDLQHFLACRQAHIEQPDTSEATHKATEFTKALLAIAEKKAIEDPDGPTARFLAAADAMEKAGGSEMRRRTRFERQ
jgi:hypothetical protein